MAGDMVKQFNWPIHYITIRVGYFVKKAKKVAIGLLDCAELYLGLLVDLVS